MEAMEILQSAAAVVGCISAIFTAAALFIKPVRDHLLGAKYIVSGVKCLLRADMLRMYYAGRDTDHIRQYDRENFEAEYRAYKALGGNSFIDNIYGEVIKWEVDS